MLNLFSKLKDYFPSYGLKLFNINSEKINKNQNQKLYIQNKLINCGEKKKNFS